MKYPVYRLKVACLGLILLLASSVFSQTGLQQRIANAPTQQDYPNADGVTLLEERSITINHDGTVSDRFHRLFKIFTQVGWVAYSDPRFQFNSKVEKIKILCARTYMADGSIVELPDNARHLLTPRAVVKAPAYFSIQELAINHTALEKGAVIELELEKQRRGSVPLVGEEIFGNRFPVAEKVLSITLPKDMTFHFVILPPEFQPQVQESDTTATYTWKVRNLAAIPQEKGGPFLSEPDKWVAFSTANSWQEVIGHFCGNLSQKLTLPEAGQKKVQELTESCPFALDKVLALHQYVREVVDLVPVEIALSGTIPRAASEVCGSNYGTPLDKAALLIAMLQNAGFTAQLAFSMPTEKFFKEIPGLERFDHVWVVAKVNGRTYCLHPTFDLVEGNRQLFGATALVVGQDGYEFITHPTGSSQNNAIEIAVEATLGEDGSCDGKAHLRLRGYFSPAEEVIISHQEEEIAQKYLGRIFDQPEIANCYVRQVSQELLELEIDFKVEGGVKISENFAYFSPKDFYLYGADFEIPLTRQNRHTYLKLLCPFHETLKYSLNFPEAWELAHIPPQFTVTREVGSLHLESLTEPDKLILSKHLVVEKGDISPQVYKNFRQMLLKGAGENSNVVIFKIK